MRRKLAVGERKLVYAKTCGHCAYCGCDLPYESMQVDHAVSLHNHGEDSLDNMLPSCRECNYYKRGSNVDGFRRKLKRAFGREEKCDFVKRLESKYSGWNGLFYFERMKEA